MPTTIRLLEFQPRAEVEAGKLKTAKATLDKDVMSSIERSIQKLPILGQQNPEAALLVERNIDDWMLSPAAAAEEVHARFDRQRQLSIAAFDRNGGRRVAKWLRAHPHMTTAVNS